MLRPNEALPANPDLSGAGPLGGARKENIDLMKTFNGIGTTLYGKSEEFPDGSFISTEWFVFANIPIIPLSSYRVYEALPVERSLTSSRTEYQLKKIPIYWKQVLKIFAFVWGSILGLVLLVKYIPMIEDTSILLLLIAGIIVYAGFAIYYVVSNIPDN